MKRRKGFIALLLSVVMVMSLFSGVAFASESTTPTQTQATEQPGEPEPSQTPSAEPSPAGEEDNGAEETPAPSVAAPATQEIQKKPAANLAPQNADGSAVTSEQALTEAIGAIESDGTVALGDNITLRQTLTITGNNKTVTLELNGNTITNNGTVLRVTGDGVKLIIQDSSGDNSGKLVSTANSASVLQLQNNATAKLESGTIEAKGNVTEIYPANGCVFTMIGGIIRSGNSAWVSTDTGKTVFSGGKIYAEGASGIGSKFYDAESSFILREEDGAFTVLPNGSEIDEYHVAYGDMYYDNYGTISDASSALYNTYKDEDGVAHITINEAGSGTVPLLILSEGELAFTLNEGASIAPDGTKQIKIKSGAKVTVKGSGTVAKGTIVAHDSNMEIQQTTVDGSTTYTAVTPVYYKVGEDEFVDLNEAVAAAIKGDGTVTLLRNATQTTAVTIPEEVEIVLDLSGYTLTMTGHQEYTDAKSNIDVTPAILNHGALTVENGEISTSDDQYDAIVNTDTGSVTIESNAALSNEYVRNKTRGLIVNFGGTVKTAGTLTSAANHGIITYGGYVEITGGALSTDANATSLTIYNRAYDTDVTGGDATVNISGGTLTSNGYVIGVNHIRSGESSLTITGGSLSSTGSGHPAIYWPGKGALTIGTQGEQSGPAITSANGSAVEICCGALNIYGGTFTGGTAKTVVEEMTAELAAAYRGASGGSNIGDAVTVVANRGPAYASAPLEVNIEGGTFFSNTNCGLRYFDCNLGTGSEELTQDVSVTVTNGSFTGGLASVETLLDDADKRFISGGAFGDDKAEENLAEGLELIENGEGSYGVREEQVVQVGESYYSTLGRALANAQEGETVKLLKDITLDKTLSIDGKSFTLDLNGRTISGSVATTQVNKINTSGLLCVGSGSTVTITDLSEGEQKGSITNTGTTTSRAVAVRTGASVTLENGVNLNAEGGSNCSALYIYTNDANAPQALVRNANLTSDAKGYPIRFDSTARAAKLTIEGGTFHRVGGSPSLQLIYNDSANNTTIKGGTFHNWSTASDGLLVADGYCVVVKDEGMNGELTGTEVTVQQNAPESYAASIDDMGIYYLTLPEGNLYYLLNRGGERHAYTIRQSAECSFSEGKNVGTSTGAPTELTLRLEEGVVLTGSMPVEIIDILVTGEGMVADGFFTSYEEGRYQVTSEQTPDGTLYRSRLADEFVAATVILSDGTEIQYDDLSTAVTKVNANSGSTLRLEKDLTLTESGDRMSVSGMWTLDLNGHDILYTGPGSTSSTSVFGLFTISASNAALTVRNSVSGEGGVIESTNATVYPFVITRQRASNSRLVIEKGVTVKGPVFINDFENATLDVYGTIDTTGWDSGEAAIYNNGSNTNNSTINLYDGSVIKSNTLGVYHPGPGTLNVYGGAEITAGDVGIEMRAGTLNVYDGAVITSTGTGEPSSAPNGSGATSHNAAVAIAQHDTKLPVVFNAYGGTFTGSAAVYESNPQGNDADAIEKITLNIENGMFEGKVESATQEGFISGGTFTVEPATEDIYPGLQAVEDGGNFTIARLQDVYVSGTTGNDDYSGMDAANAVQTLEHALKLVADDGTIYVCGTVTVDSSLTADGVKIERADGFTGQLISVNGAAAELTLKNTSIDGKNVTVDYGSYLVFVTNGGTLNIESGTELINNKTTAAYVNVDSFLNMNGGAIKNNTTVANFGGGGIYNVGTTVINGGEISGNTASIWGGGILSERGSITLNGGEIKNNFAEQGAGLTVTGGTAVLDGATISENQADFYGGGVYLQGYANSGAQFEMKSGSITGNTSGTTGAGIFGYVYNGPVDIEISGGTIKDNVSTDENIGHAIGIYGYEGSIAYPRLELSGSPEIDGDIYYQNDYEDGYVIHVTGAFTPAKAIEINRSNNKEGIPAVEYAAGLTPNLEDFVSGTIFEKLVVEGQNLVWMDASIVYFYDEDGTEFKENRHGVVMGETIDPADVPTPVKEGYTLTGWYEKNAAEPWDFAADTVSKTSTKLYAQWNLNAPDIAVSADVDSPHIGTEAVLTATPSHDLDGVTYTYQWYKDGEPLTGETGNQLTVSESGSYTVKVKASDGAKESAETESAPVEITIEGHVYVPEVTAPTCTEQGYTTYTCAVCGDSYVDDYTTAEGHQAAAEWLSDGTSHWHACTMCGTKLDEAAHSFAWVTDKEATATDAGSKHEECSVCGYKKAAVEIPATGTGTMPDQTKPGDGQGAATTPQTGDNSNMLLWIIVCIAAAGALAGTLAYKKIRAERK